MIVCTRKSYSTQSKVTMVPVRAALVATVAQRSSRQGPAILCHTLLRRPERCHSQPPDVVKDCFPPVGKHRQRIVISLALVLATALATQNSQSVIGNDSPNGEPVILDVRIGTIASTVIAARRVGDIALLPVVPVLTLAELRPVSASSEYLSSDSLAVILRAPIVVDWDELTVTISDDGALPVSRRAGREQRRAMEEAVRLESQKLRAITSATPVLPRSLIVDYDATASGTGSIHQTDLRLALGATMLGGALDVDMLMARNQRPGISGWYWDRELSGTSLPRYVRVGHTPYTYGSVLGTGIFLSSVSAIHDDNAAPIPLAGTLGRGWDIEVYHDDLLAYSGQTDATGRYAIAVPMGRGSNRITVKSYGPDGEQRSATRYVSVADNTLPAHVGAYDIAIGRCANRICDFAVESTIRYAPGERITSGAGLSVTTGLSGTRVEPSMLMVTRLRDDLNASFRYSRQATSADLRYAPSPALDASITYAGTRLTTTTEILPARHENVTAVAVWRIPRTPYAASAMLALTGHEPTDTRRLNVSLSLPFRSIYLRPFADVTRQLGAKSLAHGVYVESPISSWLPLGSRVRVAVATAAAGGNYTTIAVPLTHSGQLQIGAAWLARSAAPRLTMSLNLVMRAARYDARSTNGSGGTTVHALSGSLMITPAAHGIAVSSSALRGRASITGRVFLDANENGVRDEAEPLLPDVSISVGDISVETDSSGVYRLNDVVPYAALVLSVDSLTLPSPDLIVQAVRVTPLPNGVTRIDLPASTRPRSGFLPGSSRGIGGLPQDPQRSDPSPVHRDNLEAGVGNPNPVTDARKSPEAREYITAERRPVAVGDFKVIV
jgi:hypothetical protein